MAFLAPAFLAGAAALLVPIVLHLRARDTAPPVPFSAVRFLQQAPVDFVRHRRLRDWWLLLLRVGALLLLVLAFARPYLAASDGSGAGATVVAVDTSFSLGAPGQMERARALARDALARAPREHLVAVVAFSDTAEVVVEPTADRAAAMAAVARLQAGFGTTRYRPGLARAGALVGTRPGRIIVVTDLQRVGWEGDEGGAVPAQAVVELADVGPPAGNLAVTAVERGRSSVTAVVLNAGHEPRPLRATLQLDGRPLATVTATAAPGVATDVHFPMSLPDRGVASVTVDDEEGPPADNTRYLVLEPPAPVRLLLVTMTGEVGRDAFYLERALLAGDEGQGFALETVAASEVATLAPRALADTSVAVVTATRGLDRRGRERLAAYVREGGNLLVVAGPDVDQATLATLVGRSGEGEASGSTLTAAGNVSFAPVDLRHPVFRAFGGVAANLGQVRFRRTRSLAPLGEGQVVARFSDGREALVEYRVGRGRVVVFASDLDNRWNDFPLHPTFVPFVHETVRYLAGPRDTPREWLIGAASGGPRTPGAVLMGSPARLVAVNVDPRESDLARVEPREFDAAIARLKRAGRAEAVGDAAEREARQRLWWYALLGMGMLLATESVVGRRAT